MSFGVGAGNGPGWLSERAEVNKGEEERQHGQTNTVWVVFRRFIGGGGLDIGEGEVVGHVR